MHLDIFVILIILNSDSHCCHLKGTYYAKNHFYKVFEHSCVAAVCENNQPIMLKIHQLIFFYKTNKS